MKFDNIKHKLRNIFIKTSKSEIDINRRLDKNKVKKIDFRQLSCKRFIHYESDWLNITIDSDGQPTADFNNSTHKDECSIEYPFSYYIDIVNCPLEYLPYIKYAIITQTSANNIHVVHRDESGWLYNNQYQWFSGISPYGIKTLTYRHYPYGLLNTLGADPGMDVGFNWMVKEYGNGYWTQYSFIWFDNGGYSAGDKYYFRFDYEWIPFGQQKIETVTGQIVDDGWLFIPFYDTSSGMSIFKISDTKYRLWINGSFLVTGNGKEDNSIELKSYEDVWTVPSEEDGEIFPEMTVNRTYDEDSAFSVKGYNTTELQVDIKFVFSIVNPNLSYELRKYEK